MKNWILFFLSCFCLSCGNQHSTEKVIVVYYIKLTPSHLPIYISDDYNLHEFIPSVDSTRISQGHFCTGSDTITVETKKEYCMMGYFGRNQPIRISHNDTTFVDMHVMYPNFPDVNFMREFWFEPRMKRR